MEEHKSEDMIFMKQALMLAKKGLGWTNPHPMVGAVIVKNGKVIGKGYHARFGRDHAEMDAIKNVKSDVKGAVMYTTLEPCHLPYDLHGERTQCTEVIRSAGIQTVHIAMLDSNPQVCGRGKKALEKMGIKTTLGLLETEALKLNEAYHHFMTRGRPFVAATFSVSLDGRIATRTGESQWITNAKARAYNHGLRAEYQAILVGIATAVKDNPHLGARMKGKKDPIRIILDSTLKIPLSSKVLRDNNVIIATTQKADKTKRASLTDRGIKIIQFPSNNIPVEPLLSELAKQKIISIFVEGGGAIHGSFFDARVVDKVYAFYGPVIIGGEKARSAVLGVGPGKLSDALWLKNVSYKRLDDNILAVGYTVT